tara:strand:- start:2017 stop:2256 length:240 start_codon:yes stop_codon:yes gene_type:complete
MSGIRDALEIIEKYHNSLRDSTQAHYALEKKYPAIIDAYWLLNDTVEGDIQAEVLYLEKIIFLPKYRNLTKYETEEQKR